MADEITVSMKISVSNGDFIETFKTGTLNFNQAGQGSVAGTIDLSSNTTVLDLSKLNADGGWFAARNLDQANKIQIGTTAMVDSTAPSGVGLLVEMEPSEPCMFRTVSSQTITCRAAAGTARMQYIAFND